MATVKKGDFVELEYTGKVKEDNLVFDTTNEKTAKESNIYNPYATYGPSIVCIGEHQLLKGLDEGLQGKEVGKEYTFDLKPEDAFGKKSSQLLKLIPLTAFKNSKTRPEIGMQVEIDGNFGIVKTVTGGRVVVDFNHPLSSKELLYTVKVNKIITDNAEKIKSLISLSLNLRKDKIDVSVSNGKAVVKMLKLPDVFKAEFEKKIKELVPTIKELVFEEIKAETQSRQSRAGPAEENSARNKPLNTSKQ